MWLQFVTLCNKLLIGCFKIYYSRHVYCNLHARNQISVDYSVCFKRYGSESSIVDWTDSIREGSGFRMRDAVE